MKLKSRILLSVLSVSLLITTNLGVSAAKHKIETEAPGFAMGLQISDLVREYYTALSNSSCTKGSIERITRNFLDELGTELNTICIVDPHSRRVSDLNNKRTRIEKIQKTLIGWLEGTKTDRKGNLIFKTSQDIKNYCKSRTELQTRYSNKKNLDDFVVDDNEILYSESSSSSSSDSESSDLESSSSSSSDSESSDSESSSSSSSDSESSDSESSSSSSSDSESSDLESQKFKRKLTYSDVESNSKKKFKT